MATYSLIKCIAYMDDEQSTMSHVQVILLGKCKDMDMARKACLAIFDSIYGVQSFENINHYERQFVHPQTIYHNVVTFDYKLGHPGFPIINNNVSQYILHAMRGSMWKRWTSTMVKHYNWAKRVHVPLSDKEHKAVDKFARIVLKWLKENKADKFKEDENGRLVCLTKNFWE